MSCAAPEQGPWNATGSAAAADGRSVIQGRTSRDGAPVVAAYVRLLDSDGEFTAEVVSGPGGEFRFFAAPGRWLVRALAPGSTGERSVEVSSGLTDVELVLTRPDAP